MMEVCGMNLYLSDCHYDNEQLGEVRKRNLEAGERIIVGLGLTCSITGTYEQMCTLRDGLIKGLSAIEEGREANDAKNRN